MNIFYTLIPKTAYAMDLAELMSRITKYILNPLILFLFAAAALIFAWGLVEFLSSPDNEEAKTKGRQHMLWGVIGMFIMISVFGIMNLIINTFGLTAPGGGVIVIPKL